MNTFTRANAALQHDLAAYTHALSGIVTAIPQAHALCDAVVKETRLAQALLAFASGPQISEIGQLLFHMSNLWPYRDQVFARTTGFADEINEARKLGEEALRGARLLARHESDPLAGELTLCFAHIARYLEEEQRLLEDCHARIQPHAANMEITRKRLNLLAAAIDARAPAAPQQQQALQAYREAITLLRDWEGGVALDASGVAVLDRCMSLLQATDDVMLTHLSFAQPQTENVVA